MRSTNPSDDARALDGLAQALVPYLIPELVGELERRGLVIKNGGVRELRDDYDQLTCEEYVRGIGTPVVPRALKFFQRLAEHGEISAPQLVELLELQTARQIPANLTNSLKQRARRLGLDRPWVEGVTRDDRTVWRDRDGIASRMVIALMDEDTRRLGHPADAVGGPRDLASRRRLADDREPGK